MRVYLAGPNTQQQAEHVANMPVLLSYAYYGDWLDKGYQQSFSHVLIDSGAFSELNTGLKIDIYAYKDWCVQWSDRADAIAGLDDISGDWRKSLRNYEIFPNGFPTFHETDPPELLHDLAELAIERKQWLGIGLLPPRTGKEKFIRSCLDQLPTEKLHIHGWALREYIRLNGLSSVDSTNWWRDAMRLKTLPYLKHLHYGECLDIVVKRYQRESRNLKRRDLFD
jgi:hypothetical protein